MVDILHRVGVVTPTPDKVYDALTTAFEMTVSACTTPLNFDMPALTVSAAAVISIWLAVILTLADAVTVIPLGSSFTELPLLSLTSIVPGPSRSVTL